jgi:hypothetical protein
MQKPTVTIEFRVGRQHVAPATRKWLVKKTVHLSRTWATEGREIITAMERYCGFGFPAKTISEGMIVHLFKYKQSGVQGEMDEAKPLECNLYIRKSDTWRNIKTPLVHELIHCLMWQKYYFDLRTRKPTFFADVFADELMTCVVECLVLDRKPSHDTCEGAISYALDEAVARLSEPEQCRHLVQALMKFFREYRLRIKNKESNILKERENILIKLPSLVPRAVRSKA